MNLLAVMLGAAVLIIVIGLIMSLPVMLLWNYCLVGAIAGVNEITWLQAWGILVLFGLLFKTHATTKN